MNPAMSEADSPTSKKHGGRLGGRRRSSLKRIQKGAEKDSTLSLQAADEPLDIIWTAVTAKVDPSSPQRVRPKSTLKTETHHQQGAHSRPTKASLDLALTDDFQRILDTSSQSLDSSILMLKSIDIDAAVKNYSSTGTIDVKKLNRAPKSQVSLGNDLLLIETPKQPLFTSDKILSLNCKSHSSRNLVSEPGTRESDRRNRRAHSVRDMRAVKEKTGQATHHRQHSASESTAHSRRSGNKSSQGPSAMVVTKTGYSPQLRSPKKSLTSTRQLEIGPDGELVALTRKAPLVDVQGRRKNVVRRVVDGEGGQQNHEQSTHLRQSSRRHRQSSTRPRKDAIQQPSKMQDKSPERQAPLRAPSGCADLLPTSPTKDEEINHESKSSHMGTVGTADDLTDSEQGAELEFATSPRCTNTTMHSRSNSTTNTDNLHGNPRAKMRHRVRASDMRQLGKQNVRQIFLSAGKGSLPLPDENVSDNESDDIETDGQPAQFEIALLALKDESPTTSRPEVVHMNTSVSKRFMNVTKSPFKVAGKLWKKAAATAGGETEYTLPGTCHWTKN
ncbi:hypothetical protein MPSEU_000414200 [Mayamaea pseudoterrestris]|nr:hypothetical protein MPSEU_000414200 [Mayamaea pseudoterrestris]